MVGRAFRAALAVATLLGAAACLTGERGSGKPKTEVRQVEAFSDIDVGGALDADVSVAVNQTVEVSGDDNLVPLVTTEVKDGRLRVKTTKGVRPKVPLVVRITVPRLTSLSVSGAGHVNLRGVAEEHFKLHLSGAAEVAANGSARHIEFHVSGAGAVDAKGLKAERADVAVSGAGKLDVYASQALDVHISGAGQVGYYGNPSDVRQTISGAGSLEKR